VVEDAWELQLANLDRWLDLLEPEQDNLRAALAWSRDADAPEYLLRLAKAIWRFWWVRGFFEEGRGWLDVALDRGAALEPALQAEALEGAAGLAWAQGDLDHASELAERARSLFTALGDRRGELASLTVLGLVALTRADFRIAERLFKRSRELAEELEIRSDVAVSTHNLGSVALAEGDLERAARRYEVALALYRAEDSPYGVALSELYLGLVAVESGRSDDAASYLGRALPVFREMGFLQYAAQCVDGIAAVANARGHAHDAVRLLAAASALRERTGDAPTVGARLRKRETAATQAVLGESSFAAAWAEGRALADAEAFERAQLTVTG
jgi:tetratricopeptide (TPR) repeat protein